MKPLFDLDLIRSMLSARGWRGFWHEFATGATAEEAGTPIGEKILNDHIQRALFIQDLEKWAAQADAEGAIYFDEKKEGE